MAALQTDGGPHLPAGTSPLVKLPIELLLRVTDHLSTPELGNVRLACRHTETALLPSFVREFFVRRVFMVSPISLRALVDICNSRMAGHMRYLQLVSHRLEGPATYFRDQSSIQYLRHTQLRAEQEAFTQTGQDVALLAEALRKLPNLQDVVIRDTISYGRTREGKDGKWNSYGYSEFDRQTGTRRLTAHHRDITSADMLATVLCALAAAGEDANVAGLELLLRKYAVPWVGSFYVLKSLRAPLQPALLRMEKLHLCVGDGMRLNNYDQLKDDIQSFELREFLGLFPNLRELRFNGVPDDQVHGPFIEWLALPVGSKVPFDKRVLSAEEREALDASPPPIDFPKLEVLSLGRIAIESETLERLVGKFAKTLQALELWEVALRTRPGEELRTWKRMLTNLTGSGCGLDNLRRIKMGRLRFRRAAEQEGKRPFTGPIEFASGLEPVEYTGPDWRAFMKETMAQMQADASKSVYPIYYSGIGDPDQIYPEEEDDDSEEEEEDVDGEEEEQEEDEEL